MSVENEATKVQRKTRVDRLAFNAAPKVYSHQEATLESNNEVCVIFGISSPFDQVEDMDTLLPHTAVFMTFNHFEEFVEAMNEQLSELREAGKIVEQSRK